MVGEMRLVDVFCALEDISKLSVPYCDPLCVPCECEDPCPLDMGVLCPSWIYSVPSAASFKVASHLTVSLHLGNFRRRILDENILLQLPAVVRSSCRVVFTDEGGER